MLILICRDIFIDPATNHSYVEGQHVRRPRLAQTLRIIAQNPNALYEGEMAETLVQEIADWGGIITEDDLATVL